MTHETIAAIATPPGRGGVGMVRVSGPLAPLIARGVLGRRPAPRRAVLARFRDAAGATLDTGLALFFPAPASFTGEDVLELHGHGGPVVMDMLLARVLELGARPARPGEFSERAFLNDKLDLAQAEAVADLIDSASQQAARAAARSLEGGFSRAVESLVDALTDLRIYVEAAIDFPDEEVDFLSQGGVEQRVEAILERLRDVQTTARQGTLLREGMTVVIAGRPNAGKSSLLNALAKREAAIVTDIPGTTRDLLREYISIDGMPLHIVDTAGLRDDPDPVEAQGIERAWRAAAEADHVLLLLDDTLPHEAAVRAIAERLPAHVPVTLIYNKIDLSGRSPGAASQARPAAIAVSALTGSGLDALAGHLVNSMGYAPAGEGAFTARRRHLDALGRAAQALEQGREQFTRTRAGELLADDLLRAQQALGEITGEVTADDLLGRIFGSFCIGK